MKERLGIHLDDEDLKRLILEAQRERELYDVRPRTRIDAPLTIKKRLRSNERAPRVQTRGSFDYRRKGKEHEDIVRKNDVRGSKNDVRGSGSDVRDGSY